MRAIKNLLVLVFILAVIGAGAVVVLRVARQKPSTPETIKPNLVAVSAAGIYVYAAKVGTKVILFDTGADPDAAPVDAALQALLSRRADVTHVFLTHGHGDHAAGAAAMTGAKIFLGAADVALAEKKASPEPPAAKVTMAVLNAPAVSPSTALTTATTIAVGDGEGAKEVKAIPAAGHTAGSTVFIYDGVLFAGDTMNYKQGRLDRVPTFFDSNPEQAKAAIIALKKELENVELDRVCTGHGGCTPKGLGKNLLADFVSRL